MKAITDKFIDAEHERLWGEAVSTYGEDISVPSDVVATINARIRALYCLQQWDGNGSISKHLSTYMVNPDVVSDLVSEKTPAKRGAAPSEESTKRSDRYDAFIKWSQGHVGKQFTTDELVKVSGFSYPTTLKFLDSSQNFRKVKKGLWEVRDPKADRISEKNS